MSNIRPSGSTKLKMPFADRSFDIVGSTEDISVFGAIKKGGGYWEPQIMNLMVRLVRPTDVCLDIGANLGAHHRWRSAK